MVQSVLESMELERGRSKERRDNKGVVYKVQKKRHNRRKNVGTRKKGDPVPRIQNKKEKTMVELESGGVSYREKSVVHKQRF